MSNLSLVSDWIYHVLGALGLFVSGLVGVVQRNRERSKQNKRDLRGTANPNHEGVLKIAKETRKTVDRLDGKIDSVADQLDELNGHE